MQEVTVFDYMDFQDFTDFSEKAILATRRKLGSLEELCRVLESTGPNIGSLHVLIVGLKRPRVYQSLEQREAFKRLEARG